MTRWLFVVGVILGHYRMMAVARAAVIVNATDDIFAAGLTTVPAYPGGGGGTLPQEVSASGGTQYQFNATGTVTFAIGQANQTTANPDGQTALVSFVTIASPSLAFGIKLSGYSGANAALVGVFLADTLPATAPVTLSFLGTGMGNQFSKLSPLLGQVFYIGDGFDRTGFGTPQTFTAPVGTTHLYLGLADSVSFNGLPGSYDNNGGSYTVTIATVPEPESGLVLLASAGSLLIFRRQVPRELHTRSR